MSILTDEQVIALCGEHGLDELFEKLHPIDQRDMRSRCVCARIRAAELMTIAALREPTAAMIRAGYACQLRGGHAASAPGTMADQYRAMIDAALEAST